MPRFTVDFTFIPFGLVPRLLLRLLPDYVGSPLHLPPAVTLVRLRLPYTVALRLPVTDFGYAVGLRTPLPVGYPIYPVVVHTFGSGYLRGYALRFYRFFTALRSAVGYVVRLVTHTFCHILVTCVAFTYIHGYAVDFATHVPAVPLYVPLHHTFTVATRTACRLPSGSVAVAHAVCAHGCHVTRSGYGCTPFTVTHVYALRL